MIGRRRTASSAFVGTNALLFSRWNAIPSSSTSRFSCRMETKSLISSAEGIAACTGPTGRLCKWRLGSDES